MPLPVCRRLKLNEQYKYQPEYYKMERETEWDTARRKGTRTANRNRIIHFSYKWLAWAATIGKHLFVGKIVLPVPILSITKLWTTTSHYELTWNMWKYNERCRTLTQILYVDDHTKSLKCKMENAESNTFVGRCHGHRFRWRSSTNFLFVCWRADDSVQAEKLLLLLTSREWLELTHTKHFVSVNKLLFYCTCEWIAFSLLNAHHGHNMRVFVCIYLLGIGLSLVGGLLHFVRSLASLI